MKRLTFEADHDQFRDSVRAFMLKEVAPYRDRFREEGIVDRALFTKAGELGFLCTWADPAFGGAGVDDFRFEQIIIEENIRHGDSGFYINLHNDLVAPYIAKLGTEAQKQRFMPGIVSGQTILAVAMTEPSTGSDLAGMKSTARRDGDEWILNGAKTYISNGILSDLVVVAAKSDPENPRAMSLFLIERGMPGFERGQKLAKMGLKSQDTSELFFSDVRIPATNVLGEQGKAFSYLTHFLAQERLVAAIGFIAAAQTAFDLTLDYVIERKAFGRPIGAFQNTRFKMAQMRAEIDAIQTFVDQCVLLLNAGTLSGVEASSAKLLTSELEGRVLDECVQLHGGAGYMDEYRISRMYTDARVSRIYAGTSEIMREIIGRSLGLDERTLK